MKTPIYSLDEIGHREIDYIIEALAVGGIIAYPTDTLYGLGIDIYNINAVKELYRLKKRDHRKPVSILYSRIERLIADFTHLSSYQLEIIRSLLPGPITLLLPVTQTQTFPEEFVQHGYSGVRLIDLEPMNRILDNYPHPITTTSVNPAGAQPAGDVAQIRAYFENRLAVIIDNGPSQALVSSTLVKVEHSRIDIIREGAVSSVEIGKIISEIEQ